MVPVIAALPFVSAEFVGWAMTAAYAGSATATAWAAGDLLYSYTSGEKAGTMTGKALNAIKLYAKGVAGPIAEILADPMARSDSTPAGWMTDPKTGASYDPKANAGPVDFAAALQAHCLRLYSGPSGERPENIGSYINGNNGYCTARGYTISAMSLSSLAPPPSEGELPAVDPAKLPMWPKDGKCTYRRTVVSGTPTFSGHPQDSDCWLGNSGTSGGPVPPPRGVNVQGGKVTATGGGSDVVITINPDGSVTVSNAAARADGTTQKTTLTTDAPVAGVPGLIVQGVKTEVFPGTGSNTGATPLPTVVPTAPPASGEAGESDTPEVTPGTPAAVDGLYTKQTGVCETFDGCLSVFVNDMQATQLWSSATNFLSVSSLPAGVCGGMSSSFDFMGQSFPVDVDTVLCGPSSEMIYGFMGVFFLFTCGWAAFRIALL